MQICLYEPILCVCCVVWHISRNGRTRKRGSSRIEIIKVGEFKAQDILELVSLWNLSLRAIEMYLQEGQYLVAAAGRIGKGKVIKFDFN